MLRLYAVSLLTLSPLRTARAGSPVQQTDSTGDSTNA